MSNLPTLPGFIPWPQIEYQWANESVNDGTVRMLQAFLTTMM